MVAALGRYRDGRTADDLLGEAMLPILSGERAWRRGACSFVQLIVWTMRSQASHWRRDAKKRPQAEAEPSNGEERDDLDQMLGDSPEPWRLLTSREEDRTKEQRLDQLEGEFSGDPRVAAIIRRIREGRSSADLVRRIGAQAYGNAMLRLSRRVKAMGAVSL